MLARVFKDIFPRYKTMCGYYVERKGGWDCHGLPVELAVEAELGFTSKEDIERYGIAEFNARCRETVLSHVEDWNRLTERIGFWIDLDDAYRTLDPDYIESVWWALKTIHDKGLLYEKLKVVPYCPRDETDALEPRARAARRLPRRGRPVGVRAAPGDRGARRGARGRRAARLDDDAVDARLQRRGRGRPRADLRARAGPATSTRSSSPRRCVERVLGESADVLDRFPGRSSSASATSRRSTSSRAARTAPRATRVLLGDFVTAEDGTGLVHTAIAFGEDDFRLGEQYGLNVINPVRLDGTYDERIGPYAGRWVKDADPDLIEDLRARGRLLRAETYEHSYPHCWRCGTPLLYYAKPSWYIATSQIKDRLLAANETVNWHPEHVKHGRFGKWLEGNVDWALSRERYWGTPLPVWRCENEHVHAIGSFAELAASSPGTLLEDPHRPFVDEVTFPCAECGEPMRAGARGDRRVVRLGLDAVRPVPRAARERGALRGALPRRLHLRGARPDARLVLLAARGLDAAVRPVAATATSSASA